MVLERLIAGAGAFPSPAQWNEIVKQGGPFAGGAIFGASLALSIFWLASRARTERHKVDEQREKELFKQIGIKEKRIDELHQKLLECIEKRKGEQ